jgi:hypothetical protein
MGPKEGNYEKVNKIKIMQKKIKPTTIEQRVLDTIAGKQLS